MDTPKQRLEKIFSYYNTNASDIERRHRELYPKSKFTKQTLYNIELGLTKSISGKNALILKELFPDIDYLWLTTGNGNMINDADAIKRQKLKQHDDLQIIEPDKKTAALDQLSKITNGKNKNAGEGKVLNDGDIIKIKTFVIPMKGFAGLKNAIYDDQYIMDNFAETTTEVPHHLYSPVSYRIQSSGNSMPISIPNNSWVTAVPVPEMIWMSYKFIENKIYVLFHPYRGILFKYVRNLPFDEIELCSQNEDKDEYPDEKFKITEFRKILLAIKVESFI